MARKNRSASALRILGELVHYENEEAEYYDLVYLVAVDHIRPTEAKKDALIPLVYVAMTRARYRLVIPYVEEMELISRLKRCIAKQP